MQQIKYKSGTFLEFIATRSFAVGNFDIRIAKGSEVLFDGSKASYGGDEFVFPELRSAVAAGWIVLSSEYNEDDDEEYRKPPSAKIHVRPAVEDKGAPKTLAAVAERDERIVMSSADHAASTRTQNRTARVGTAEAQEGVPVRSLKTPSRSRSELTGDNAGAKVRAAEHVQITPGVGVTVAEMLDRMSPEQRDAYLAKKASVTRAVSAAPTARTTVGRVKRASEASEAEGMKARVQFADGTVPVEDLGGGGGEAPIAPTFVEEDGIKFTNTNGPKKGHRVRARAAAQGPVTPLEEPLTSEARREMALLLCPEFPATYDFSAPPKKKIARLMADFEDRIDVLMAVFAAEDDAFKAELVDAFPAVFA